MNLKNVKKFRPEHAPLVFEAAAQRIENGPWCRGSFNSGAAVCAWGAIYEVTGVRFPDADMFVTSRGGSLEDALEEACKSLPEFSSKGYPNHPQARLTVLNDTCRDKRKVVRHLRRLARLAA